GSAEPPRRPEPGSAARSPITANDGQRTTQSAEVKHGENGTIEPIPFLRKAFLYRSSLRPGPAFGLPSACSDPRSGRAAAARRLLRRAPRVGPRCRARLQHSVLPPAPASAMPKIPREKSLDGTIPLLRDPYRFIAKRCRRYGTDLFE